VAERSQIQYQPITGPVWREPVAERLAWMPRGQQPARTLPPNRLGDVAAPPFQALYGPDGLQWLASDRYFGQPKPYALTRHIVLDPIPPANPRLLDWQSQDRYAGRSLPRAPFDTSVYPRPVVTVAFDPQNLDWMPRGTAPRVPVERRLLGDFQQPPFEALFKSERLQWQPIDRYIGKARAYSLQSRWITDPKPITAPFNPSGLQWLASGSLLPCRSIPAIRTGAWVVDPTTPPDPIPAPSAASITVRAFALGYFDIYRNIGDTFVITTPYQYSPYWMAFVDTPPADWTPYLSVFSDFLDREMLEFGRPQ
jgi:hypothetical protein